MGCLLKRSHLYVSLLVYEQVLRFEVSVDDSLLVEVLQALDDLGKVETSSGLAEPWVVLIHQVDVVPVPFAREGD